MKQTIIGIVLASVALYLWGFIVWGMGPYGTMIWKQAKDDSVAAQLLKEQFAENGTYMVPAVNYSAEELDAKYQAGPVAFVHMMAVDGRPAMDSSIMLNGFLLNLIVIVLIAMLMKQVESALPTYRDRIKFAALAGMVCAMLVDIGDVAWWQMDLGWMFYRGFYHVTAWIVTAAVLGFFVGSKETEDSVATA